VAWFRSLAGVILLGQIIGEMLLLAQPDLPSPTEIVYFAVGLLMAGARRADANRLVGIDGVSLPLRVRPAGVVRSGGCVPLA
jgi:hypothetical protein